MTEKNAFIQPDRGQQATAIHLVDKDGLEDFLKARTAAQRAALRAAKFEAEGYAYAIMPDGEGWAVATGVANVNSLSSWCLSKLAEVLPAGTYRREGGEPGPAMHGWITGQYRFDRYKSDTSDEGTRVLVTKDAGAIAAVMAEAEAVALVRDLVNTPAEDMGPAQLEAEVEMLARAYKAEIKVTRGDMLEREFPMVHMVGRAAARSHAPRMIELEWGDPAHPRIAIVGKGVCFDSGGLDIKAGLLSLSRTSLQL